MTRLVHDKAYIGALLIIEDDTYLSEVLAAKMREVAYNVVAVTSPQDAIHKLRNQRFDCVILDMVLQRGFGMDLLPVLKSHWKNGLVPIIVTSGTLDVDLVKRLAGSVKGVYVKPYDIEAIVQKVQSIVTI